MNVKLFPGKVTNIFIVHLLWDRGQWCVCSLDQRTSAGHELFIHIKQRYVLYSTLNVMTTLPFIIKYLIFYTLTAYTSLPYSFIIKYCTTSWCACISSRKVNRLIENKYNEHKTRLHYSYFTALYCNLLLRPLVNCGIYSQM